MSNFKKNQTKTVFKPSISFTVIDPAFYEKCTILHCIYHGASKIGIWPNTCLVQNNGSRKKMVLALNIPLYPEWMVVNPGHCFTLVFEGLDKDCDIFHLREDIPEPGGFYAPNIKRNELDVYRLELT